MEESQSCKQERERAAFGRKETSKKTKKTHYVYKSIDDVIEESKKPGGKKIGLRYAASLIS